MRRRNPLLSAAITAALVAPAAAQAQVDTSDWKCEYCPFDEQYRAEYEAGASVLTGDDAFRYGNGTGYDDEGAYAELGGEGRYVGESTDARWYVDDLGLDSRSLGADANFAGRFDLGISYRGLPYRLYDTTTSPYRGTRGDLALPDGWVNAPTTGGMTELESSSRPASIELDREILGLAAGYAPTESLRAYADYRHTQRDGVRITGGSNFTNAALLPRAIDDQTDEVDLGVHYASGALSLAANWYGSFYSNKLTSITWDNAFVPAPGAERLRLATEPDNKFTQISLTGIWRSNVADTVVAVSAAAGEGTQDDYMLPYTINPTLTPAPLPVTEFDGKVDTTNYALTVTSRPLRGARVKLSYRFDERDNQTPVSTWNRVITDTFVTTAAEQNLPYSYERGRLNISGSYRLFDTVKVEAGYDRTDFDRELQEVASQTEETGWGKLRWRPTPYLEAVFKGGESRREIDEYDTDVAAGFGQNPLMRKYNLAYRYREFAEVSLQASLPETPVSVGMSYLYADDSYTKSELGMTAGEENRFTFDVSWAVSETANLYLFAGNESIDSTQAGSETFAGPGWTADHDDDFSHVGAGLRIAGLAEKVDLTFDYSRGNGETEIRYSGSEVSATPLPELESDLDSLRFRLSYRASDRLMTDIVVRYETFDTKDWAIDGVSPATIPSVLSLGASSYDYSVWAFGVGFRYLTGADSN